MLTGEQPPERPHPLRLLKQINNFYCFKPLFGGDLLWGNREQAQGNLEDFSEKMTFDLNTSMTGRSQGEAEEHSRQGNSPNILRQSWMYQVQGKTESQWDWSVTWGERYERSASMYECFNNISHCQDCCVPPYARLSPWNWAVWVIVFDLKGTLVWGSGADLPK